jgi:hypothetical protein
MRIEVENTVDLVFKGITNAELKHFVELLECCEYPNNAEISISSAAEAWASNTLAEIRSKVDKKIL